MNWEAFWGAMVVFLLIAGVTLLLCGWSLRFAKQISAPPALVTSAVLIAAAIDFSLLWGWLA